MTTNRRILLNDIPKGMLTEEYFSQDEIAVVSPG